MRQSYSELESKAQGYLATMKQDKEEHGHMEELLRVEMAQHVRKIGSANLCETGGCPFEYSGTSDKAPPE